MTKRELRTIYLSRRLAMNPPEMNDLSERIADRFFESFDLGAVTTLHSFLPIIRFNEIDTTLILRRIWSEFPSVSTVAPRTDLATGEIESVLIGPANQFAENAWGIPEPTNGDVVAPADIDLVLVPLLCSDISGHRVGYGKGYYDRFLSRCRADCAKVGLGLYEPVTEIEDVTPYDIRLDTLVTPGQIYKAL